MASKLEELLAELNAGAAEAYERLAAKVHGGCDKSGQHDSASGRRRRAAFHSQRLPNAGSSIRVLRCDQAPHLLCDVVRAQHNCRIRAR